MLILESMQTSTITLHYIYGLTCIALLLAYIFLHITAPEQRLGLILKPLLIPLFIVLVGMIVWPFIQLI